MKKIEQQLLNAIENYIPFTKGNTKVVIDYDLYDKYLVNVYYKNQYIAKIDERDITIGSTELTLTIVKRLNMILTLLDYEIIIYPFQEEYYIYNSVLNNYTLWNGKTLKFIKEYDNYLYAG